MQGWINFLLSIIVFLILTNALSLYVAASALAVLRGHDARVAEEAVPASFRKFLDRLIDRSRRRSCQ